MNQKAKKAAVGVQVDGCAPLNMPNAQNASNAVSLSVNYLCIMPAV